MKIMYETDEFDELENETIAAGHLFDDIDCDNEQQLGEYGDYGIVEQHYHNSGCGCLTLIPAALSIVVAAIWLVMAF